LFPQIPSMEASGRLKITAFLFTRSMELLSLALLMLSVHKFNYHYQFRVPCKFIFYIFSLSILKFFQIIYSMNLARIQMFMSFSRRISFTLHSMDSTVSKFKLFYLILV
jgi:hypothetical protein